MPTHESHGGHRLSRESRLLLVTILVSVLVLVLLARLRFPSPPATLVTSVEPLQRLAARASYDELAAALARTEAAITPNLIVLRVAPRAEPDPVDLTDLLNSGVRLAKGRFVPALRLTSETAVATIGGDLRIDTIVGATPGEGVASITASDTVRSLARLQVPPAEVREFRARALADIDTPTYVAVVEGTNAGVTIRPVFLGRGERFSTARWSRPLLPLGGIPATAGALIFTLDGEFVGMVVKEQQTLAIAAAADVLDAVQRLTAGNSPVPFDAGIAVQPLNEQLAAATGASSGIVISSVTPGSAAAGTVQAGDVITHIDGAPVAGTDEFLFAIAARHAGATVTLTRVRGGEATDVNLTLMPQQPEPASSEDGTAPVLTAVRGKGTRVVDPGRDSPLAHAGLQEDDLITAIGTSQAPAPRDVLRLLSGAASPRYALLEVERAKRQRVMAVAVPAAHVAQ
jgi:hypothetical protein